MSDNNDLILARLSELHSDLSAFRTETSANFQTLGQRTSVLETHVAPFFENDGGRAKMQAQIDSLNKARWYGVGFVAAITTGGHWLLHKLGV